MKITSSNLLFLWDIKHVHTGTRLQKTRKQHCDPSLIHFINLNTMQSFQMVQPPPAKTGGDCQNMFSVKTNLHLG